MTDQQQIDRLIKALMVYKAHHYPLDLTESDYDILMDALKTIIMTLGEIAGIIEMADSMKEVLKA